MKRKAYIDSLRGLSGPTAPAAKTAPAVLPGLWTPAMTFAGNWATSTSLNVGLTGYGTSTSTSSYVITNQYPGTSLTGATIGNNGWYDTPYITLGGPGIFAPAETPQQQTRRRYQQQLVMPDPQNQQGQRARALKAAADFSHASVPEIVALDLLKQQLSPEAWRRYLNYGFIVARGASGLEYQIIRGEHHVKVFRRGQRIAELCIYMQGVPPTDEVIAKKILVECDELGVWGRANIRNHPSWPAQYQPRADELLAAAKAAA